MQNGDRYQDLDLGRRSIAIAQRLMVDAIDTAAETPGRWGMESYAESIVIGPSVILLVGRRSGSSGTSGSSRGARNQEGSLGTPTFMVTC